MPKILFYDFKIQKLLADPLFSAGGSTIQIYSWIQGLISLKQNVGIFYIDCDKTHKNENAYINKLKGYDKSKGIPKVRWIYYRFPKLLKEIKRYRPDYIYQSCAGHETATAALICKVLKLPLIYRVANDIESDERVNRLAPHAYWGYKLGIKHSTYILCQNKYQYNNLSKKFPQKQISIIHNPFYIPQGNVHSVLKSERKYIAWVGLFQYQKNMMGLFNVARNIPSMKVLIAGKNTETNDPKTDNAIKRLLKLKNVEFVGYISRVNIRGFLNKATILLNTSHYEGFSNTFLEAFSVGTPVITTRKVDPDNIIEDNNLGSVCDLISELPETINKFITLKNIEEIRDRCIKYVRDNHNPNKLAKEMMTVLGQ
jgi:glycosyltransferase involved in cell wall biosynthesis